MNLGSLDSLIYIVRTPAKAKGRKKEKILSSSEVSLSSIYEISSFDDQVALAQPSGSQKQQEDQTEKDYNVMLEEVLHDVEQPLQRYLSCLLLLLC